MSLRSALIYKITASVLKNFVDLTKFQQALAYLRVGNYALGTYALGSLTFDIACYKVPGRRGRSFKVLRFGGELRGFESSRKPNKRPNLNTVNSRYL